MELEEKLIYGKNPIQGIVSINIDEDKCHIYSRKNGILKEEIVKNDFWLLATEKFDNKFVRLKGDLPYKWGKKYKSRNMFYKDRKKYKGNCYSIFTPEIASMTKNGYTYYKGLKPSDLSILSVDIETTGLNGNADNALVALIANTFRDTDGTITRKLFDIKDYDSDKEMLQDWSCWVMSKDPDNIVNHNILGFDLPYMSARAEELLIGRDGSDIVYDTYTSKKRKDAQQQYDYNNAKIWGREIIDTFFLSLDFDIGRNFPSYGLKPIIKYHIDEYKSKKKKNPKRWTEKDQYWLDRFESNYHEGREWDWKNWPVEKMLSSEEYNHKWKEFKEYARNDGDDALTLYDYMIPSTFYFTQSVPMPFQFVVNKATGSQIDHIMVRSYLQDGHSLPMATEKTEKFEGAISMGRPGIYENVIKADVASLYPSIMLQYEIYDKDKDPNANFLKILKTFTNERLKNKQLFKETGNPEYDALQASQKIAINSKYGFMGANGLLFNSPHNAAKVTEYGREILKKGVLWATGYDLVRTPKKVVNEGTDEEYTQYEYILGEKLEKGLGYELTNVDTDAFSVTNGKFHSEEEFENFITKLNELYPSGIVWETDGNYSEFVVVRAKNYVMREAGSSKIKYKGNSVKDQKKEKALREFLDRMFESIIETKNTNQLMDIYHFYLKETLNIEDINRWTSKKTITKKVLNPETPATVNIKNSIDHALKNKYIEGYSEGDKIWVFTAIDGLKQKITKGKPVFIKKTGEPKMIENKVLRFPEAWNKSNHDKWHYVERVWKTMNILNTIVDIDKYPKYHNKTNRSKLEELCKE